MTELVGGTPMVWLTKLAEGCVARVAAKLESFNPCSSVKDRIGVAMIRAAEKEWRLGPGAVVVEPTSGNTGIGLALVAAVKGYKLILVMPESMSIERRRLMAAYGAELELTPREKGMSGAIARAREIAEENKKAWIPMQFENEANVVVHRDITAQEILNDFPEGVDYLITGVGTGGHITGVAQALKAKFPNVKVYAVEPELSPVLSGGKPGPHPLQGIGAGFIPAILKTELLDGIITVSKDDAFVYASRAAKEEGLFVGVSSGATLAAVAKKLPEIKDGSKILIFTYDTGERYLSIEGLF